jgi:hypothetical protein
MKMFEVGNVISAIKTTIKERFSLFIIFISSIILSLLCMFFFIFMIFYSKNDYILIVSFCILFMGTLLFIPIFFFGETLYKTIKLEYEKNIKTKLFELNNNNIVEKVVLLKKETI